MPKLRNRHCPPFAQPAQVKQSLPLANGFQRCVADWTDRHGE
jgi:hypothetical protein